jgi:hypothetical protein
MAEFRAILAAPFFGKYFHLAGYVAMEDLLWQSFLLLLLRLFSVNFSSCVAWSNGGFIVAEFRAIITMPFPGKYFHLARHEAIEDSLWQS